MVVWILIPGGLNDCSDTVSDAVSVGYRYITSWVTR